MTHAEHATHEEAQPHAHGERSEAEHPAPSGGSERYELEDLFSGEAPENQHFLKVAGMLVLVVLLALALAYPFVVGWSQ